jgi:hypothetical protein
VRSQAQRAEENGGIQTLLRYPQLKPKTTGEDKSVQPKTGHKQTGNTTCNQPRLTENKLAQKQAGRTGLYSPEPKLKQETGATNKT